MTRITDLSAGQRGSGGHPAVNATRTMPVLALGLGLSLFLVISYVLCVLFYLVFPDLALNHVVLRLLPGFKLLTWPSFFLGLVESFAYGWYVALVFGPIYNFFAARVR